MKEMSGESQNQGSVHYVGVLICKASTNGGWSFRMTSNSQHKSEMSYWVALFVIALLMLFSPQFIRKDKEWKRCLANVEETQSKTAFSIDLQGKHKWGWRFWTTSTSSTHHTQIHKINFSADRWCLWQLQSSYVAYEDGFYTMVIFVQLFCHLLGWPGFHVEFLL
jgi:hypothetical protein